MKMELEDTRLSQAMKHFYGKKAKTRDLSNTKNIEEVELTPKLDKANMSVCSAGTTDVNASTLGVINERT